MSLDNRPHYSGGCQCGAVRYEVTADINEVIACNCSRCGKLRHAGEIDIGSRYADDWAADERRETAAARKKES